MEKLWQMNEVINGWVWGRGMIALLLGSGALLMFRCRFLPLTHAKLVWQKTMGSLFHQRGKGDGVTSFQAVATALAGTLGVGSVIGVATALTIGGPGALFWMWISAFFGMMSKYGEVVLAIIYRRRQSDGSYLGGPMTTLEYGCHMRWLGVLFALLCLFASFGIGNITPVNTISMALRTYVPIPAVVIGIGTAIIVGTVILGSAKRIMRFNEIVVPIISMMHSFPYGMAPLLFLLGWEELADSQFPRPCITAFPAVCFPMKPGWEAHRFPMHRLSMLLPWNRDSGGFLKCSLIQSSCVP